VAKNRSISKAGHKKGVFALIQGLRQQKRFGMLGERSRLAKFFKILTLICTFSAFWCAVGSYQGVEAKQRMPMSFKDPREVQLPIQQMENNR
jgi:hypothetical protein